MLQIAFVLLKVNSVYISKELVIRAQVTICACVPLRMWIISKLPVKNVGRGDPWRKHGDCPGQVAADFRNILDFEFFVRVPRTVLQFHYMFLKGVMSIMHNSDETPTKNYANISRRQHGSTMIH